MMQVIQIAIKDLKLLIRDKLSAFFILGFPLLMGLFFGAVMGPTSSGGATSKIEIAVVDEDQSSMSQQFVTALQNNDSLNVVAEQNLDAARNRVRKGQLAAVIYLEPGFGETAGLFWEAPPTVKIGADPSKAAQSAMLQGFVMEAIGQLAAVRFQDLTEMTRFVEKSRQDLASDPSVNPATRMAISAFLGSIESLAENIDTLQTQSEASGTEGGPQGFEFANIESMDITRSVDPNSIQGQMSKTRSPWDISFPQAMLWGVLGCAAGFAISMARERSEGTLTRLQVAPISRFHVLLGKALACFLAVIFVVSLMTGLGLLLGMKPGSYAMLIVVTLCIAFCFVGLMMVMSLLGRTEQSVSGAGWAMNLVMAMIGGCMIPVMFMPKFLQQLSVISPVRWAIVSLEGAIWRGFSWQELILPCSILLSVGALGLFVGTALLKAGDA